MPAKLVTAVVVPLIPTWIESAVVVLPIVLPLIVTFVLVPAISMPRTTKPTVAVALLAVMLPTMLFLTSNAPGEAGTVVAKIPSVREPVAVEVTVMAPLPVDAPIVFPVVVPMFTDPPRTLTPAKTPGEVDELLVVERAIPETVFP